MQQENSSRDLKGRETRKQGTQQQQSALPQNKRPLLGVRLPKMFRAAAKHMRPRSWYVFFRAKIGIGMFYSIKVYRCALNVIFSVETLHFQGTSRYCYKNQSANTDGGTPARDA